MGGFFWDECHKFWDDEKSSLTSVGLGSWMMQILLCVNFAHAPYDTKSFFNCLIETATEYFANTTYKDEYFLEWYEYMRLGCKDQLRFGSDASLMFVWSYFKKCVLFYKCGDKVKWSRWWSVEDKLADIIEWWWPLVAMIGLTLYKKGVYKSMHEFLSAAAANFNLLKQRFEEMGVAMKAAGIAADGRGRQAMRHDDAAHMGRTKGEGILTTCVATMACPLSYLLAKAVVVLGKTIRLEHARCIEIQKTRRGTRHHVSCRAVGDKSLDFLHDLIKGLSDEDTVRNQFGFGDPVKEEDTPITVEHEVVLGYYVWDLVVAKLGVNLLVAHA